MTAPPVRLDYVRALEAVARAAEAYLVMPNLGTRLALEAALEQWEERRP